MFKHTNELTRDLLLDRLDQDLHVDVRCTAWRLSFEDIDDVQGPFTRTVQRQQYIWRTSLSKSGKY